MVSYEKFCQTIYFFKHFNYPIDEKIVKKMSDIYFIEFVGISDFYEPTGINDNQINYFNKSVDLLPSHIKSIVFGSNFNQPVQNLPTALKELVFGNNFNQEVNNLPQKLFKLIFGNNFNKPVQNLPTQIKILSFGSNFNQSLDYLPCSITHLEIKSNINIDNLPASLKYLIITRPIIKYNWNWYYHQQISDNITDNFQNISPLTKIIKSDKQFYLYDKKIKF